MFPWEYLFPGTSIVAQYRATGMNHGDYEDIQGGAMICAKAPV